VLLFGDPAFHHADLFRQRRCAGGAYATGVLVLMTSAVAVTLLVRRIALSSSASGRSLWFSTTIVNIIERPDG
jgi:hypothetical protein